MLRRAEAAGRDAAPDRQAARAALDRELAALSPAQRQAVVLRYLEGRSEQEAAAMAGCPLGTLSRRASDGSSFGLSPARKNSHSCRSLSG